MARKAGGRPPASETTELDEKEVEVVAFCLARRPWEHPPGLVRVPSPMLRPRPAGQGSTDGHREVANGSGSLLRFETVTGTSGDIRVASQRAT